MDNTSDDMIIVGPEIPRIRSALPMQGRQIEVTWTNGTTVIVDLSAHLAKFAIFDRVFAEDEVFRDLKVGNWGYDIAWSVNPYAAVPVTVLERCVLREI